MYRYFISSNNFYFLKLGYLQSKHHLALFLPFVYRRGASGRFVEERNARSGTTLLPWRKSIADCICFYTIKLCYTIDAWYTGVQWSSVDIAPIPGEVSLFTAISRNIRSTRWWSKSFHDMRYERQECSRKLAHRAQNRWCCRIFDVSGRKRWADRARRRV